MQIKTVSKNRRAARVLFSGSPGIEILHGRTINLTGRANTARGDPMEDEIYLTGEETAELCACLNATEGLVPRPPRNGGA
jgi:hypothetical protein